MLYEHPAPPHYFPTVISFPLLADSQSYRKKRKGIQGYHHMYCAFFPCESRSTKTHHYYSFRYDSSRTRDASIHAPSLIPTRNILETSSSLNSESTIPPPCLRLHLVSPSEYLSMRYNSGTIEFDEFLDIMWDIKHAKGSAQGALLRVAGVFLGDTLAAAQAALTRQASESGNAYYNYCASSCCYACWGV